MNVIAFGHKRRVGKDTASRFLMTHFRIQMPRKNIMKGSFANTLKDVSYIMYKWAGIKEGIYYENNPEERYKVIPALGMHVVDVWIKVGNLMRSIYEGTWIEALMFNTNADILIISDLRYPNEAQKIRDMGGILIRIDRPDAPISNDVSDNALNDWTDWDYIIHNKGTLKDYSNQIHDLIPAVKEKFILG